MIDPVALLIEYHAALNAFDFDKSESMFDDNALYISPGLNGALIGRGVIMAAMKNYFAEFADQVSTDSEITKLNEYAAQAKWQLTATSNMSSKKVHRKGTEVIHFSLNGLIASIEVKDE